MESDSREQQSTEDLKQTQNRRITANKYHRHTAVPNHYARFPRNAR